MKIVERTNIDVKLWDEKITNSSLQNPFIFSFALDATAYEWCAIVNDDYSFLLPIPFDTKFGVRRARQHYYSRQLDWIGSQEQLFEALEIAKSRFREFDFGLSLVSSIEKSKRFQFLNLSEELHYRTNTKRILKKKKFEVLEKSHLDDFIEIYRDNSFTKFKQPEANLDRLKRLFLAFQERDMAKMFVIKQNGELKAGAIFVDYKSTRTYIIGDSNEEFKKGGAMFYLMDHAIVNAPNGIEIFDFGGSNVESVANFYKKFGGKDQFYSHVKWENLPGWFAFLKKFKK